MNYKKRHPRIHSLSTVGIRNHYNSDYLFHPFRTDFAGDSGVGKSIIADTLQLILIGEREFKSATDSSSEREAKKLVVNRYGYVFLNIEIDTDQYIVIGMYISPASIDPFIIQMNLGLDIFEPFSTPILSKDFMSGDDIVDLPDLYEKMSKDKQVYATKISLNKYHELLEQNKILPLNLKTKGNLRNFAQIIRAFSRGKGFRNDSKWLKEFFLNDDSDTVIMTHFQSQLSDIAQEFSDHKENKETLNKVRIKYDKFKKLFDLKQTKDTALIEYLKSKVIFHFAKLSEIKVQISDSNNNRVSLNARLATCYSHFFSTEVQQQQVKVDDIVKTLSAVVNAQEDIDKYSECKTIASERYPNLDEEYIQLKRVNVLLEKHNDFENLRKHHTKQQQEKIKKEFVVKFEKELKSSKLHEKWLKSSWANGVSEGQKFHKQRDAEIDTEITKLEVLKEFSDIGNTKSLVYWAVHKKPLLSHEEESILFNLDAMLTEKPLFIDKGAQYIPIPETFFENISILEVENDKKGFWVDLSGIRRFITYIPERFFTENNSDEIINYFTKKYNTAKRIIEELKEEKSILESLSIFASKHGEEAINAFIHRKEVLAYQIDSNLDVTETQLEELMNIYFNGEDIKQTKENLDKFKESKIKGDTILYQLKDKIQQEFTTKPLKDVSFVEFKSTIQLLLESETIRLKCKKNRELKFNELFLNYIQKTTGIKAESKSIVFDLKENQNQKHEAKKTSKRLNLNIKEEEDLYDEALLNYQAYTNQPLDATKYIHIKLDEGKLIEDRRLSDSSDNAYKLAYNNIVLEYINENMRHRFMDSDDFLALTKEVVNEIPAKQLVSNETDALQQMLYFLEQLNETYINIGNRKLSLLKDIFRDVRDAVSDYILKIDEIKTYFKGSDKQISQGYKLNFNSPYSSTYPIGWIDIFLEMLDEQAKNESMSQGLFAELYEKTNIQDMMAKAFEKCGGFRDAKIEDLLNPKNYFDIEFKMQSDDGEQNVGSAGQTYAVTAMLCVARLSLIEKREKGQQQPGLRFMPIDESEGIGSNFELLELIAKANDYQIISMSINPLDDFREGEQYLYILNGSKNKKERLSTFAIFSSSDEIKKI